LPILRRTHLPRADGATMPISRILVDAGWLRDTVYQSILAAGGNETMAAFGRGIRATHRPLIDPSVKRRRGVTRGHHWQAKRVRGEPPHVVFDANYWKSFASSRLRTPLGADGCGGLYAGNHSHHKLLMEHLAAERPTTVSTEERTIEEWDTLPGVTDNHWLDTLVNCLVGASHEGAHLAGETPGQTRQRRRKTYTPPPNLVRR